MLAVATLPFISNACREQPTEKKTVVVEKKSDDSEGALERSAKKVDNEVNEEIDKQIDKIGDDN